MPSKRAHEGLARVTGPQCSNRDDDAAAAARPSARPPISDAVAVRRLHPQPSTLNQE